MSEDRYTYPTHGEDPRERDEEFTDAEEAARVRRERQVTNPQHRSATRGARQTLPATNPADRDRI